LQLVWVHGHGQCVNCATTVVPCCTGAGQEADEHEREVSTVTVADVVSAFACCSDGATAVALDSLVHAITTREACTYDSAMAAIERAVAMRLLAQDGRVLRLLA
jgi:hypothetical protein